MAAEEIHIRNMVCGRCIMAVKKIFHDAGIEPLKVELGTVLLERPLENGVKDSLRSVLEEYGFELIDDRRSRMLERITTAVIELVHYGAGPSGKVNLSEYLSGKCHADYSSLSKLFSEMKGESIEKYYIAQKIERVKELLDNYGEVSDAIGRLTDREKYEKLSYEERQRYTMELSSKYVEALEKYRREKEGR